MASISSNGTGGGNSNVGGSWAGGIVPVEGDKVTIVAGDTITMAASHIWGDDTTTAININGSLVFPTTSTYTVTAKGDMIVNSGGVINMGRRSTATQIPNGNTAGLILNYSAALAQVKYGLLINDGGAFYAYGATRTTNTTLSSGIVATATSCTVADATGWQVGDIIVLATSDGTYNHHETRTLTSVAGNVVGWTSGLSWAHASGCRVGNFTSNVSITSFNTSFAGYFGTRTSSSASNSKREMDYVSISYVTNDTSNANRILLWYSGSTLFTPFVTFTNVKFRECNQLVAMYCLFTNMGTFTMDNLAFHSDALTGQIIYTAQGSFINVSNSVVYFSTNSHIFSFNGSGGQGCTYTNFTSCGSNAIPWQFPSGNGNILTNSSIHSTNNQFISAASGSITLTGCNLGTNLWGTPVTAPNVAAFAVAQVCTVSITDGKTQTTSGGSASSITTTNPNSYLSFVNKSSSVTSQEFYTSTQILVRDNSTFNRSPSSEKFNPIQANTATGRTYSIPAPNNTLRRVIGYLRYDANYTNTSPPSVTLSGLGITPQTFTAGASTNTWYQFNLSATQTSGADGNLTLTVTGQSPNTNGFYWVDGVIDSPYVTSCRHYGYLFDNLIYRTVDSVITQTTEATVAAYTGIGISGSTITLSSNHSIQEVYDYCKYYVCANLSVADFFTSTDGRNFSSTYNLTINTGVSLTGTGAITLTGGAVLTMTGTAQSSLDITHTSGTKVWTRIRITNIVANSRVQLYDNNTTTELYNGVPGTSLEYQQNWTADHTIRYRVAYQSGTTAKAFVESTGTFTSSGLTIQINQEDDAVYNAIGVDGSTVTECSITGTTLLINITDPDNTTSIQRIYAFEMYWLQTSGGIRDQSLYIDAKDSTHYQFDGGLQLKNDQVSTLEITGGNIFPATGSASSVIDSTGGSIIVNYSAGNFMPDDVWTTSRGNLASIASKIILGSSKL